MKTKSVSPLLSLARERNWIVHVQLKGVIGNLKMIKNNKWCRTRAIETSVGLAVKEIKDLQEAINNEWIIERNKTLNKKNV